MATFVLVHGAWHGGWCWQKVATLLRQEEARVFCPTLTGLGERAHLAELMDPVTMDLNLHQNDVAQVLKYQELEDVILVGHAYAGMVITGVAQSCSRRLSHLVYLNGVTPADGESMVDQLEAVRGPEFTGWIRRLLDQREPFLPPPDELEEVGRRWGITDPGDLAWVASRVTPHPSASFAQPIRLDRREAESIPRSFVGSSEAGFESVAGRAKAAGWRTYHMESGHDPMVTHPRELTAILLDIARQ